MSKRQKPAWARCLETFVDADGEDSNTGAAPEADATNMSNPIFAGSAGADGGWSESTAPEKSKHRQGNAWGYDDWKSKGNWADGGWSASSWKTRGDEDPGDELWAWYGNKAKTRAASKDSEAQHFKISDEEEDEVAGRVPNSWPDPFSGEHDGPTLETWERLLELWIDGEARKIPVSVIGPRILRVLYGIAGLECSHLTSRDVRGPDGKDVILQTLRNSTWIQELEDVWGDAVQMLQRTTLEQITHRPAPGARRANEALAAASSRTTVDPEAGADLVTLQPVDDDVLLSEDDLYELRRALDGRWKCADGIKVIDDGRVSCPHGVTYVLVVSVVNGISTNVNGSLFHACLLESDEVLEWCDGTTWCRLVQADLQDFPAMPIDACEVSEAFDAAYQLSAHAATQPESTVGGTAGHMG